MCQVAYVGGDPRVHVFSSKEQRDNSIIDAEHMSAEDIMAMLERGEEATLQAKPKPIAELTLKGRSVEEVHSFLAAHGLERSFPKDIFFV